MKSKLYIYNDIALVQKHTGIGNCTGCFFTNIQINITKNFPCCIKMDGKFLYPCSKDIIYIEDNSKVK